MTRNQRKRRRAELARLLLAIVAAAGLALYIIAMR